MHDFIKAIIEKADGLDDDQKSKVADAFDEAAKKLRAKPDDEEKAKPDDEEKAKPSADDDSTEKSTNEREVTEKGAFDGWAFDLND